MLPPPLPIARRGPGTRRIENGAVTEERPATLPPRGRRIAYLLAPTILLLGLLGALEIGLRAAGIPKASWSDLFDPGVELVGSARTGFALEGGGPGEEGELPREGTTIACFGDSVTYGSGVRGRTGGGRPYPALLEELLRRRHPGVALHVRSFGVPGFTSEQGRVQYEELVASWRPDVLVVGYGFNDGQCAPSDDRKALAPETGARATLGRLAQELHLVRLAHLGLLRLRGDAGPSCERRVDLPRFRENLLAMLRRQAELGKAAVLVDSELGGTYTHEALPAVAATAGVPLVDLPRIFHERERERSDALAARLGLAARVDSPPGTAVARVLVEGPAPASVAIHFQSAEHMTADTLAAPCADDGVAPDEKAGDGVWSARIPVVTGLSLHYLFSRTGTEPGYEMPKYGFATNPMRRWHTRLAWYGELTRHGLPIVTYGDQGEMAEKVHPNAAGYGVVARAVADAVDPLLPPPAER